MPCTAMVSMDCFLDIEDLFGDPNQPAPQSNQITWSKKQRKQEKITFQTKIFISHCQQYHLIDSGILVETNLSMKMRSSARRSVNGLISEFFYRYIRKK